MILEKKKIFPIKRSKVSNDMYFAKKQILNNIANLFKVRKSRSLRVVELKDDRLLFKSSLIETFFNLNSILIHN